jgi:uncharacterized repeat protein (TIGR01451 family)
MTSLFEEKVTNPSNFIATGTLKMTSKIKTLATSTAIAAMLMTSVPAFATTAPGVDILNNVTVDFQVGGVAQTQATASDTFKVDRKILFTVVERTPTATTNVSPGQTGAITSFTVTNTSNDVLDFALTAANLAGGAAPRGTDTIDVSNLLICLDADNNGACDAAATATLTLNDLAKDGGTTTVLILGDVAAGATTGQLAGVRLTATARNSDGTAITGVATDATVNTTAVETIYADTGRDGVESALDDYTVAAAALSVFKSSKVITDGVSTTNPKAIPGATVEYCISVANAAGSAVATNINIGDLIPANTTFVAGSILVDANVTSPGSAAQSCTAGNPGGTYVTTPAPKVSGALSNITGGTARALIFRVTIN